MFKISFQKMDIFEEREDFGKMDFFFKNVNIFLKCGFFSKIRIFLKTVHIFQICGCFQKSGYFRRMLIFSHYQISLFQLHFQNRRKLDNLQKVDSFKKWIFSS